MTDEILKLDMELTDITNRPLKGMTDYLVENYHTDELHIMQRLLRQRQDKELNHLLSLMHLAESIKGTLNKPYLKGFKA